MSYSCFPLSAGGWQRFRVSSSRRKISSDTGKSRRVNNSRCRVSRATTRDFIALPHAHESYIRCARCTRSTCIHAPRDFAHASFSRSFRCSSRCAAALRMRAKPRRVRHRSCMARCSIAFKPKESSPTARRSPTRSRNPRPRKSCADTKRSKDLAGFSLRDFVGENFVDPGCRGERIPDRAARRNPRARRQAVGRADANAARFTRREFAASALDSLRRARRPLSRAVLLGFLLHDGGSADQRPRRSRGRHGRELCRASSIGTGTFRMAAAATT